VTYPGELNAAIAAWLSHSGQGGLVEKTAQLSASYRKGQSSSAVDLSAYVVSRVPATFAANVKVLAAVTQAMPDFSPHSLLDIGTGPGTASWAALARWPELQKIIQCEQDQTFAWLASKLNAESGIHTLQQTNLLQKSEAALQQDVKADVVVASYLLAELPLHTMPQLAQRLWARTSQVLVMIEPGTPQGFARLRSARDTLSGRGAFVLAPCTHQNACPMKSGDWCHFKTRVQRSREHMHAKNATVPFEDEAFAYLIVSRMQASQFGARIVAPPRNGKVGVVLPLCDGAGLHDEMIARRDKATYKRAKKKTWGQVWGESLGVNSDES
jgi:ribosomal protein RSM22 (predicted rRNA methylase)